ncbi:hypothetical protein ARMGADRAFT_1084780 [Armillaria gallica]|uniref:Uncharacterized protein n=1 Tax=Armillaria gallica TaxID=47427 RepID=A0A2H3D9P1_ARMGA|nr:hypothetical protein ARMGADRAFT_1084780 [Armillaria gallica]
MPQDFMVHVYFECTVEYFSIIWHYTNFWIKVPSDNNGHEPVILLACQDFTMPVPPLSLALTFTMQFPHNPLYFEGASYVVALNTIYPINGMDGSEVLIQSGAYAGINITSS